MTRETDYNPDGISKEDAKKLLHQHRIEKLLVVDDAFRCIGLNDGERISKKRSEIPTRR